MTTIETEINALAPQEERLSFHVCGPCREMSPDANPRSHEWNRLRPCHYYRDSKEVVTHVCVDCAETVQVFEWLNAHHPIPGAELRFDDRYVWFKGNRYPFQRRAVISAGEMSFRVWSVSCGDQIRVQRLTSNEDPVRYENSFQAWFAIAAKIAKGDDPKPAKGGGWGTSRGRKLKALFGDQS